MLKNWCFWTVVFKRDSGESLRLQGDQTSQSLRKSTLNTHWNDWCWSWSSNTLTTWCKVQWLGVIRLETPQRKWASSRLEGRTPKSQLFASGGQSIGASASAWVLPMSIQGWFPLGLTGLISLQSERLLSFLQHHNLKASIFWHSTLVILEESLSVFFHHWVWWLFIHGFLCSGNFLLFLVCWPFLLYMDVDFCHMLYLCHLWWSCEFHPLFC